MPGSSASIATPNTILNTVIAEELRYFADVLENAEEHDQAIQKLIKETIKNHKRIIFNGNGYDESWIKEAEARGLSNLSSTPDALAHYLDEKNLKVFINNGVLTEVECRSRYEIYLEKYYKTIGIEARTLLDMIRKDILPAVLKYENTLSDALIKEEKLNLIKMDSYSRKTLVKVNELLNNITVNADALEEKLHQVPSGNPLEISYYYRDEILPLMKEIRQDADELETIVDRSVWPIPTYRELLFGVD